MKRFNRWFNRIWPYSSILILVVPGIIVALLGLNGAIRESGWWPRQMVYLGSYSAAFSILAVALLLVAMQSRLICAIDGRYGAGASGAIMGRILRVLVAFCTSFVTIAYAGGMFVLVHFLSGLQKTEEYSVRWPYPWWFIAILAIAGLGLTIANCWYAYHSRKIPVAWTREQLKAREVAAEESREASC